VVQSAFPHPGAVALRSVHTSNLPTRIPLVEPLKERTCGVWIVNIETGQTLGFLRFEAGVQKIFAVQVLRKARFPELLVWNDERLAHSYVLPDAALKEVSLPTAEQVAQSPAFHFQRGMECYRKLSPVCGVATRVSQCTI
jgi:hypothetical protein